MKARLNIDLAAKLEKVYKALTALACFSFDQTRQKNSLSLAHQINTYTVVLRKNGNYQKSTNVTGSKMTEIALHHMWQVLLIFNFFNQKVSYISGVLLKHP